MSAIAAPSSSSDHGSAAVVSRRSSIDVRRPVLICGVGRSGTSLLQSMLNAHPALSFPPETHFFRRYVAPRRRRSTLERGSVGAMSATLGSDPDFARAGVAPELAVEGEADGAIDLVRVFARILALYADRQGKERVGDKDPRNIDHLEALARAFPAAYVLHVIRDPREVLLSRMRAEWSKGRPWWQHALLAEDQLRRGRALGRRCFGDRYLEVRYESLVADPERILRGVAAHVDVEYSPAMCAFNASAASLVDARERSWKAETLGPLLAHNVEKWRTALTLGQVRFVERVSSEAFDHAGYRRSAAVEKSHADAGTRLARALGRDVLVSLAPLGRLAARGALVLRRFAEAQR